jgi:SAM-dependent methyltransferase
VSETRQDQTLDQYAESRRTTRGAESYATKYDRELHKRVSSYFERRVIRRALSLTGGPHARVLDLPCGAGRLTPLLEPVARTLISADYSPAMLRVFQRQRGRPCTVADAFHLPFGDRTFDLVFSARLSHHISDDALRAAYVREILRVSAGWAVFTIFDARSLKNLLRQLRVRAGKKRPKNTFTREQVGELTRESGFELQAGFALSRLASGHVFYVARRNG